MVVVAIMRLMPSLAVPEVVEEEIIRLMSVVVEIHQAPVHLKEMPVGTEFWPRTDVVVVVVVLVLLVLRQSLVNVVVAVLVQTHSARGHLILALAYPDIMQAAEAAQLT